MGRENGSAPKTAKRLAAAFVGGVIAIALIVTVGHGNVDRMTYGDGLLHRYVAQHLNATPDMLDPVVVAAGPSLRYGRIGLPASIWLLSAGKPSAMRYVQPGIMVILGAAIALMAAEFLPGLGLGAAVLPFLALGLSLSLSGGYAEPLAAAFGMGACLLARRHHWIPAALLLSLAMLTKESLYVFLLGLALWALLQHEYRGALILCLSLVPVAAWHTMVAARFGYLPLADPYTRLIGLHLPPFNSIGRAILHLSIEVKLVAVIHLALAIIAVAFWRRSVLGATAAASAIQVVFFPYFTWQFLGDTFRNFAGLELMAILAMAAWWTESRQIAAARPLP